MLIGMTERGPDSAGLAVFTDPLGSGLRKLSVYAGLTDEGAVFLKGRIRQDPPPDFFVAGGMSAALAVVEAIKKAKSTDTEKLIAAMEGMSFDTPKGKMTFRKEDHQAMQSMYHFKIKVDPAFAWGVPELIREIKPEARLSLYGNDIDETTNPLEAGLAWTVKLDKPGGFIGAEALRASSSPGPTQAPAGSSVRPSVAGCISFPSRRCCSSRQS